MLNLLLDLKDEFGLTYIFISHDLNVVRFMSDRVMVMYLGKVAEIGPADAIFSAPRHPYTEALLASMPSMDPDNRTQEAPLSGDPPNPINPPRRLPLPPALQVVTAVCAQPSRRFDVGGRTSRGLPPGQPGSGHPRLAAA